MPDVRWPQSTFSLLNTRISLCCCHFVCVCVKMGCREEKNEVLRREKGGTEKRNRGYREEKKRVSRREIRGYCEEKLYFWATVR